MLFFQWVTTHAFKFHQVKPLTFVCSHMLHVNKKVFNAINEKVLNSLLTFWYM